MSFTIPSLDDLIARGMGEVDNTLDKSENAMIYDAVASGAVMVNELLMFAKHHFDKMDVENNHDQDLDRYVFLRTGIARKMGTKADGDLLFTGSTDTYIPQGTLVTDGQVTFVTTFGDTIGPDGNVTIHAEAVQAGNHGHISADTLTSLVDPVAGVVSVTNPEDIKAGTNREGDVDLRTRYYLFYQDRATSNNPAHYRQWAMEVDGVGQVRVVRAFNGPLTVKVIVLNNNYQSPDQDLLDQVKAHIETRQSFDVEELAVVGATPVPINVQTTLLLQDGYIDEEVKGDIADNIRAWLSDYPDPAYVLTSVSYYDIIAIVKQTEGVIDIVDLAVNGGTANIPISIDQVAEVGAVT